MIRVFSAFILAILLLAGALPLLADEPKAQEQKYVTLENEFIRIVVNAAQTDTGRFSVITTGGDPSRPSSQKKHLIFGDTAPWTSYTTLRIDGTSFGFGGKTTRRAGQNAKFGDVTTPPTINTDDKTVTTTSRINDLVVAQELGFVRGTSTRMQDTVGITYRITNQGQSPHQVGLRIMLDTMCGSNDGAPVRAGNDAITAASALRANSMPDYWQAFDNLSDPSVISQGTLRGGNTTVPDKVVFADWGTLADEPWEPQLAANQSFTRKDEIDPDTSVAMFWNPVTIDPGQTRTFVTYYGIGGVTVKPGILSLGLTAPAETTFLQERTENVTITGYLQNSGGFPGRDVTMTLALPDGVELVSGQLNQTMPQLAPDATMQQSWVVRPTGKINGPLPFTLMATSANIEKNQIARDLQVNVPKSTMRSNPIVQILPLTVNGEPAPAVIGISLSPAENLYGVRFTLVYDPAIVRTLPLSVSRGRAFLDNDGRLFSWSVDRSKVDEGRITITGLRKGGTPLTKAEENLAFVKFYAMASGKTSLKIENPIFITEKGEEIPATSENGVIEVLPTN